MVRQEIHGTRDLAYSSWHRTLPDFCYMIDLDSVEWRSNRGIVAFIETALRDEKQTLQQQLETKKFESKILSEISRKTNAPAYIVFYNVDLSTFIIFFIKNDEPKHLLTIGRNDYAKFIQNL